MEQIIQYREDVSEVLEWLNAAAKKKVNLSEFGAALDHQERNWLYFNTRIRGPEDLYDRAMALLELEEEWKAEHPDSIWKLMLLPTA